MKKWTTSLRRLIFLAATAAKGILKTITGNPIHILDALAKPAQALSIALEPIQDLHGYDSPWPAGGGKNAFPPAVESTSTVGGVVCKSDGKGVITFSGVATSTTAAIFNLSESFVFPNGQENKLCLMNSQIVSGASVVFYNGGTSVDSWGLLSKNRVTNYNALSGKTVNKVGINIISGFNYDLSLSIMVVPNSADTTTFAPYSNICPISGHTDADVTRTGKNLLDIAYSASITTQLQKVVSLPAGTYTISYQSASRTPTGSAFLVQVQYASSNHNIFIYPNEKKSTFTATAEITKFTIYSDSSYSNSDGVTTTYTGLQVELGSTATAYEEYRGTTYPIPLGQTVYGGTLDVVTGVLTVDRAIIDLGTFGWFKSSSTNGGFYATNRFQYRWASDTKMLCSRYKFDGVRGSTPYFGDNGALTCYFVNDQPIYEIYIKDESLADKTASAFQTEMSGVQLVYELATPQTIQLTPQQVELLQGENNVWSDGTMTLVYLADGNASEIEALNILLGGRYVNNHEADEPTDREALDILLGR